MVVHRQGLSLEKAWVVFGMPAPGDTERSIDRIAQGVVPRDSVVTSEAGDQISSISRPGSPDVQQAPLLRQSTSVEMIDVADSQFTGLLVLTGCTVVRTSSILMRERERERAA